MKVVTSGLNYLDIDAYAGCIAYAELLNIQDIPAIAFSSATINESVTNTIRSWEVQFSTDYAVKDDDTFIIIDVSEPDYLDKVVVLDKVEEIIDHHLGFEVYWRSLIGDEAEIEFIGAACTQVYEKWQAAGLQDKMSFTSARLLISGILDNTLNFKATVTTERDRIAYTELLKVANLPDDWTAQYFTECQAAILDDVASSIVNDTKTQIFKNLELKNIAIGQLVVWDAKDILERYQGTIRQTIEQINKEWFVNIVSISEGKSYFLSENNEIKKWAEKVLDVKFNETLAVANRLWLRKEIVKQDIDHE